MSILDGPISVKPVNAATAKSTAGISDVLR